MKKIIRNILISLAAAVLATIIAASGFLYMPNQSVSDALYQRPRAISGDIMLVNIDQAALEDLGVFSDWGRGLMGDVLYSFANDPDNLPAVIFLDILYAGYSDDISEDEYLAEAVAELSDMGVDVVVGCAATFDTRIVTGDDGESYIDDFSIVAFDEPYPELKQTANVGHLNAMFDNDGIMRHGLYEFEYDGRKIPSVDKLCYEKYCEHKGVIATAVPACDERGRYYVPFSQMPGGFSDNISVVDVLYGDIEPEEWADRIVMIGPYASGMQDEFITAISHAEKMYGVEYHANMVQALIDGETRSEVPRLPQLIAIFIVTFGLLFFFIDRKIVPATIGWVVVSGGYVGLCLLMAANTYLLWPLYIPAFVTIEYLASVIINSIKAIREKRRVRATFQRYVAPEIVGELLKEGSDALGLGGKTVDIAVLFVDIRGFTTMSESLPPEQVVSIINRYLTLTSECIFKNGGTLDKYVGDCTMAFWGAPIAQEDCIYKAVKAAFDMVEGAKALNQEIEKEHGRSVDFGVGVHFGPAVVGNIGSLNRMDYTAIGDTVNTAARLEANAPAGQIFVSRVVADALEGRVEFTSLGDTIKLKGKAEGFEILTADRLVK